jgi:hypothetical protein
LTQSETSVFKKADEVVVKKRNLKSHTPFFFFSYL